MSLRGRLFVGVASAAGLLALLAYVSGIMSGFERQTVDARFHIRGVKSAGHQVVIVGLDDKSLNAFNSLPPIPRGYYARLLDRLHAAGPRLIALDVQFIGRSSHPEDDRELLEAIGRDGPVLLAAPDAGSGVAPAPAGGRSAKGYLLASVGVDPDRDNILRRMMYSQVALPTLPVRAAEFLQGRAIAKEAFPRNHAWIDFRGPPGTFPVFPFVDVLNGRVPLSQFSGKVVLVGVTAPVQKDVFVTAASSTPMSGVEVHANALVTILDGVPLRSAPAGVDIVLLITLSALPAALAYRRASLYMLAASVGVLAVFLVAVQLTFNAGWILSPLYPIVGLVLASAGSVAVDALVERRQRQALESALQGLLRPADAAFFISYRRDQSAFVASTLRAELARRFGEGSVFMDTHEIDAGQEWPRRIREAILGCSVMLVLIGPYWLEGKAGVSGRRVDNPDDWVRLEIEAALRREALAVVPVLLDGAKMPDERELPDSIRPLSRRNAIALTGDRLSIEIDELVNSIQRGSIREMFTAGAPPRGIDVPTMEVPYPNMDMSGGISSDRRSEGEAAEL